MYIVHASSQETRRIQGNPDSRQRHLLAPPLLRALVLLDHGAHLFHAVDGADGAGVEVLLHLRDVWQDDK